MVDLVYMGQDSPDSRITLLAVRGGVARIMSASALAETLQVPDYIREGRWVVCPMAMGEERWMPAQILQVGGENSPSQGSIFLSLGWWNAATVYPLERVFASEGDARLWIAENKAAEMEKMYRSELAAHRRTKRQLSAMKTLLDAFEIPHE